MDALLWGLSALLLVGGGVRALLLALALRRDEAHPRDNARRYLWVCVGLAVLGALGYVWLYV